MIAVDFPQFVFPGRLLFLVAERTTVSQREITNNRSLFFILDDQRHTRENRKRLCGLKQSVPPHSPEEKSTLITTPRFESAQYFPITPLTHLGFHPPSMTGRSSFCRAGTRARGPRRADALLRRSSPACLRFASLGAFGLMKQAARQVSVRKECDVKGRASCCSAPSGPRMSEHG